MLPSRITRSRPVERSVQATTKGISVSANVAPKKNLRSSQRAKRRPWMRLPRWMPKSMPCRQISPVSCSRTSFSSSNAGMPSA